MLRLYFAAFVRAKSRYFWQITEFKRALPPKMFFHFGSGDTPRGASAILTGGDQPNRAALAQSHTLRSQSLDADADVLVLVLFSGDGSLTDLHRYQITRYREAGYTLVLVVNTPLYIVASRLLQHEPALNDVAIALVRENRGFDFGAWAHALKVVGRLGQQRTLSFTNDSILPLNIEDLRRVRDRVSAASGAVFLTFNKEVRPHGQSYFFGFKEPGTEILRLLSTFDLDADKSQLIEKVEISLTDEFRAQGVDIETLFQIKEADEQARNPTIHFWRELIDIGFPFIKLQLFSAGFLKPTDSPVAELVGLECVRMIETHLRSRTAPAAFPALDTNRPPQPALPISTRYSDIGAMQAYNPPLDARPAIVLPLDDARSLQCKSKRVLVILHAFYLEIAEDLVKRLVALDAGDSAASFRFVVTTDSNSKADTLRSHLSSYFEKNSDLTILIYPNRGRDVASFLRACAEHLDDNDDLVLHLHTKKSPHNGNLGGWGEYLFQSLLGSPELVKSTMQLFDEPKLGMVYPIHFRALDGLRNWGFDFPHARDIIRRMGGDLRADDILDFPTGTMFWGRPKALKALIDLRLVPEEFEPEAGQIDGTLAHAIERSLIYVVEAAGYRAQPVIAKNMRGDHNGIDISMSVASAKAFIGRVQANLRQFRRPRSGFARAVPEIYDVSAGRSDSDRPRLNIIVPTVQPEKMFGGVSTALRTAAKLWEAHGDVDLRLLVTSDATDTAGIAEASHRLSCSFTLSGPEDDAVGATIVSLLHQPCRVVSLRANDYFMSTAWWTADLGFRLRDVQKELFGSASRMVYLIQDYEPGFYKWSNQYALAFNTYERPRDTIALINSEELASFVSQRHDFPAAFCVPYSLEPRLAQKLFPTKKERIILVYGRPSVARNAFEIIVEGLRRWQMSAPEVSKSWQIVIAGENFEASLIDELENACVVGKLSLDGYAEMLNRAGVGISIMISAHPSYPPLEMARAGILTLTNSFEGKDLSRRAPNISSLATVSPDAIAAGISDLVVLFDKRSETSLVDIADLPSSYPLVDFEAVRRLQISRK